MANVFSIRVWHGVWAYRGILIAGVSGAGPVTDSRTRVGTAPVTADSRVPGPRSMGDVGQLIRHLFWGGNIIRLTLFVFHRLTVTWQPQG